MTPLAGGALTRIGERPRVLVVAGDPSGDAHAARMVMELKALVPSADIAAIGGPRLREAGATLVKDLVSEAVTGFSEVVGHLPGVLKSFAAALSAAKRADLVVLVDYPGFNLRLAKAIARLSPRPRLLYYIAPQVWAWHKSRAATMSALLDRVAVVFPFEEPLFSNAVFVGHPLLDLPAPAPDPEFAGGKTVAILPGSRRNEIRRHMPVLARVARDLAARGWRPVISLADPRHVELFGEAPCELYSGDARTLLASSARAVVKSGTSTLEAALLGVPFVSIYRLSWVSYALGRLLVSTRRFAMPNILLRQDLVPELIQRQASAERIVRELLALDGATMKGQFAGLREILGGKGSARRTAELCRELLSS